ncbi:MAG: ComF family protein, partial [Calditrichota bacterium]
WAFDDVLRDAIHAVKYRQMEGLGRALAEYAALTTSLKRVGEMNGVVFPIPLHPARLRKRGYNQCSGIAAGLIGNLGVLDETSVRRVKNTVSQTHLDRSERKKNMQNAFRLVREDVVTGKVVLLVDDVLTTGATMNSCARILKRAGAARVIGCSLASPVEPEID